MIKTIQLVNFKSFKDTTIDLGKINLFIGKNNSGKSNLLQSLIILKKALYNISQGIIELGGINALKFSNSKEISNYLLINVTFGFNYNNIKNVNIKLIIFHENQFMLNFQMTDKLNVNIFSLYQCRNVNLDQEKDSVINEIFDTYFNDVYSTNELNILKNNFLNKRGSITFFMIFPKTNIQFAGYGTGLIDWNINVNTNVSENLYESINQSKNLIKTEIDNLQLILEPRYILNSKFKLNNQLPKYIDYNLSPDKGDILSNFLIYNKTSELQTYPITEFNKWIEMFGVKKVNASMLPQYQIDIQVNEDDFERSINQLGAGSRSVISVVIGCIFSEDNCGLLIEEPELGLHPEFQALMMDFIIEQMLKGKQILVTTHSEHMLTRLQRRIAEKKVNNENVGIFWVVKEENVSSIEQVTIDREGIFPEGLKTYLDFISEELSSILHARDVKEKNE